MQPRAPEQAVAREPLIDFDQRRWNKRVDARLRLARFSHQARGAKNAEVARHGGTTHCKTNRDLACGQVLFAKQIENGATCRIGNRTKCANGASAPYIRALAVAKILLALAGTSSTPENTMVTRSSPMRIISAGPTAAA